MVVTQLCSMFIYTMLVVVALLRPGTNDNSIVPETLLCTFPEALYFWTPNYYLN